MWSRLLNVFLLFFFAQVVFGAPLQIKEGIHYHRLAGPLQPHSAGKIQIVEYFSYGCPSCYRLEQPFEDWITKNKDKIEVVRIPVFFNDGWQMYAAAYYILELFNREELLHGLIFKAVHEQGLDLTDPSTLASFLAKQGIPAKDVMSTLDSFGMRTKLQVALNLALKNKIQSVPSIIVANKYMTNPVITKGIKPLFEVLDYLVKKESRLKP